MAYSGSLSWQTKSQCRGIHFSPELPRRAASKVNGFLSDGNAQSFSPEPPSVGAPRFPRSQLRARSSASVRGA